MEEGRARRLGVREDGTYHRTMVSWVFIHVSLIPLRIAAQAG